MHGIYLDAVPVVSIDQGNVTICADSNGSRVALHMPVRAFFEALERANAARDQWLSTQRVVTYRRP